jgi:hypothetical protein
VPVSTGSPPLQASNDAPASATKNQGFESVAFIAELSFGITTL